MTNDDSDHIDYRRLIRSICKVKDWPIRRCMFLFLAAFFLNVGAGLVIVPAFFLASCTGQVFYVLLLFGAIALWLISYKIGVRLCYRVESLLDNYIRNL